MHANDARSGPRVKVRLVAANLWQRDRRALAPANQPQVGLLTELAPQQRSMIDVQIAQLSCYQHRLATHGALR